MVRFASLFLLVTTLVSPAIADDAVQGHPVVRGDPVHGKAMFMALKCWGCHGTTGAGGGWQGPALTTPLWDMQSFSNQLRHPANKMPPYRLATVSDQDLTDIYVYLEGIPTSPPAQNIPLLANIP